VIDFRSGREPKSSSFDFISIRIAARTNPGAAPSQGTRAPGTPGAAHLVVLGRGDQAQTINYRSFKPEKDGLSASASSAGEGLGVPLRKYKRIRYRGGHLRPLRVE